MKIIHFCLSCFYIDGFAYQENQLVAQNVRDGHDVLVVASTESFDSQRNVCYLEPGRYIGSDGARVIRLPYSRWFPHAVGRKVRAYPRVRSILMEERPDIVFFHGLAAWELVTVTRYCIDSPNTSFFLDCHEDHYNSARTFISKWFLHLAFYRQILRHCQSRFDRVFCISLDSQAFAGGFYGIEPEKLEFFPLGGNVLDDSRYIAIRARERERLNVTDAERVFVQTGKFDKKKRLDQTLRQFKKIEDPRIRLFLAGHVYESELLEINRLIAEDPRVSFIGWRNAEQLESLLCAADIYIQPGSQSSTMQSAVCARCPVILADVPSHRPFVQGNGWLVSSEEALFTALLRAADSSDLEIDEMKQASYRIALDLLDYEKMAKKIYRRHFEVTALR